MNTVYVNLLAKQGKSITRGMNKRAKTDHKNDHTSAKGNNKRLNKKGNSAEKQTR